MKLQFIGVYGVQKLPRPLVQHMRTSEWNASANRRTSMAISNAQKLPESSGTPQVPLATPCAQTCKLLSCVVLNLC